MPDQPDYVISSAVILAEPRHKARLAQNVAALPGVELWHETGTRLVITMETATRGEAGALLTDITRMEGVLSAAMVFESAGSGEGVHP